MADVSRPASERNDGVWLCLVGVRPGILPEVGLVSPSSSSTSKHLERSLYLASRSSVYNYTALMLLSIVRNILAFTTYFCIQCDLISGRAAGTTSPNDIFPKTFNCLAWLHTIETFACCSIFQALNRRGAVPN